MFVETKKEGETTTDPFALGTLIAWLERQPANEPYNYDCNGSCLLALYFRAQGFKKIWVGGVTHKLDGSERRISREFDYVALGNDDDWESDTSISAAHTFGAALERARTAFRQTTS